MRTLKNGSHVHEFGRGGKCIYCDLKLSKCYRCGHYPEVEVDLNYYNEIKGYSIYCKKCKLKAPGVYGVRNQKDAIDFWNERNKYRMEEL